MTLLCYRPAKKKDCDQLLELMRKLAIFENYIDDFKVTIGDLIEQGFSTNSPPTFNALVAEQDDQILGYLVYYLIPFTYDMKGTLFIKEFFVDKSVRGQGIGRGLMELAISTAKNEQCGRLKWDVLNNNVKAQKFYQTFGAFHDTQWQGYVLKLA